MGSDFEMLHRWRLLFARQGLFGSRHTVPAWNPHEVLGAPFAANLQSFPWIPTRLVLLLLDPAVAFAAGVAMAAALAAIFTWLYCRRAGLSPTAAAVAGWTFACAGYFSSRIMAGHLPLLEAYPALPLLLWLVDRALAPDRSERRRRDLAALAVSCACVAVAGHPQVPAYALFSAFLYAAWRGRDAGIRDRLRAAAAMVLGIGLTLAAWWPMLMLIGRSTRLLNLAAPNNDVAMPYSRLLALIVPGIQGWAEPISLATTDAFAGYPNDSYFWDTASYMGLLPLAAIVMLLLCCIAGKRMPEWRWRYLAWLGTGALVCSLPLAGPLLHALPGTLLRSPARMLYMSTFCAAVALGVSVDRLLRINWHAGAWLVRAGVALLLVLHIADLWHFDHWFILSYPREDSSPAFGSTIARELGDYRLAAARNGAIDSYEEKWDDAGGFDSIFSARFNRAYMALAGQPADTNEQLFDASELPRHALEALGVRFVITTEYREDLQLVSATDTYFYRVPDPAPRAQFYAANQVEFAPDSQIPELFAGGQWRRLLLAPEARLKMPGVDAGSRLEDNANQTRIDYQRTSSDEIFLNAALPKPGFVYLLESYDPGWTATIDGTAAPVLPANGFAMAVPVQAGKHAIRLQYSTPGRLAGVTMSLLSLTLMTVLILSVKPPRDGEPA